MNRFRPFLCVSAQIWKGMYYFLFLLISNEARKACVSGDISTKHAISPSIALTDAWLIHLICSNPLHLSHEYWYPQTYTFWTTKYFKIKILRSCSWLFSLMWSGQKDFLTNISWWIFFTYSIWNNKNWNNVFNSDLCVQPTVLCSVAQKGKLIPYR